MGVSLPGSSLKDVVRPGPQIGLSYQRRFSPLFTGVVNFSYAHYVPERYPHNARRNAPGTVEFSLSSLPMLAGVQFFPIRRVSRGFFVQAMLGGQLIFFSRNYSGFQQSTVYRMRELSMAYSLGLGFQHKNLLITAENTYANSRGSESPSFISAYNLRLGFFIRPKKI
jgi:hypothetical protein